MTQRPPHMSRLAALLSLAACTLGCPSPDDPCDDDLLGCDDNAEAFALLDCTLTEPLTAVPGQGEQQFGALQNGDTIHLFYGSQGGQHMFAGFRLLGADPVASPLLRVSFRLYGGLPITDGSTSAPAWCARPPDSWPEETDAVTCWSLDGERTAVLGAREPLRVNADGNVEETGLLLRLMSGYALTYRLMLMVEDQCGRTAEAWVDVTQ